MRGATGEIERNCWPAVSRDARRYLDLRAQLVAKGYDNLFYDKPKTAELSAELQNAGYLEFVGHNGAPLVKVTKGGFNFLESVPA